jgi:hypothetical protein
VPPKKPSKAPAKKRPKPSKPAPAKRAPAAVKKPQFTRACSRCGRTEACAEGGLPPGWSVGMEGRRVEYLCPACARGNIRAIEGRLTEEYWEF